MSKKVKIKLNRAGVRELLRSKEMGEVIKEQAVMITRRAGEGYGMSHKIGKNRQIYTVFTDTIDAVKDNMDHNTLLKAVGK